MPGQESESPLTGVLPGLASKAVSHLGIDFHFVWNIAALEFLFEVISFRDRYDRITLAVQNENGTQPGA